MIVPRLIALQEALRIGADALRVNPLRTALSTTGVVIGVAALVAAFAITDGVAVWSRELIMRESSVQDVAVSPVTSRTVNGRAEVVRGYPVFGPADGAAARIEVPGVAQQVLTLTGTTHVEYLGRRASVLLTLSSAGLAEFSQLSLAAGRFYTEAEVSREAPVVVVGHRLAGELAGSRDALWLVGRMLRVGAERLEVIGVLAAPTTGPEADLVAFAPLRDAGTVFESARTPLAPTLRLRARSIEAVDTLRAATVDWLAARYGRRVDRLQVAVANQQLANTRMAILLTKLLLGMLVGLILAVGGIGIMNVLLASVSERTREIGIRKAVGARSRDIQLQFLVESVTITGVGAAAGFVAGLTLAFGGTAVFRHFLGSNIHPVVRPTTAVLAVGSAVLVGLVFGTYPARRAARLSPVDAIARE
ncbi:ABC transporter permease [Roseisolibacter agri]|uniref:ABC transporter permease n=1 Tax=Roseisolibacter agri TaxID=2014610 RepID=A0AA37QA60_9BACT|nr:ABC transporter permease [Roseisolibacter agri]GLC25176.1 ABC transporter permease [Roseisolibacter agri]